MEGDMHQLPDALRMPAIGRASEKRPARRPMDRSRMPSLFVHVLREPEMTETIQFLPYGSRRKWVFCCWEDGEIRIFRTREVAAKWAEMKGFRAVFGECA